MCFLSSTGAQKEVWNVSFVTSKNHVFQKAPFLKLLKYHWFLKLFHLMDSRTSCLLLVEKRSKFDAHRAPLGNAQKSKMLLFCYTVSTLDPPSREKGRVPRRPSEGPFGAKMGSEKGRLVLVVLRAPPGPPSDPFWSPFSPFLESSKCKNVLNPWTDAFTKTTFCYFGIKAKQHFAC